MSRERKILELALCANTNQPLTFVVNNDGSLSQVDENRVEHYAEAKRITSPAKPVEEIIGLDNITISKLYLSNVIAELHKNDDYLDLGNILILEGDLSTVEQHESDKHSDIVVLPQEKSPKSDENSDVFIPQEEKLHKSDENEVLIDINTQNEVEPNQKKKRHQVKISTWKINTMEGSEEDWERIFWQKKNNDGQYDYQIEKNAREMKIRCKCQREENSLLQCATLTENERKKNFVEFWRLDWQAKKIFVKLLTQKSVTARVRKR
ncbi:hypothetical protein WA026_011767 [Henosepilachna vigintioctopunctata]|uniref:Uncharacterized protein n=1 Tax=Henosepilachna vigintioctopunctata TaxID=420089 RepID=A0AAW1UH53_9CUCU